MNQKLQATFNYIKKNRWQSAVLAVGSLVFLLNPMVQCPIMFVRIYSFQQKMLEIEKRDGRLGAMIMLGEALGLRNEAIGKSCQKFTWMIPNREAKEAMDYTLKPMEF